MGHYHESHNGIGRTRKEAQADCVDKFYRHNSEEGGTSIRDIKFVKEVRKVPPKKKVIEKRGGWEYQSMVEDPSAPESEWLMECEFEIHYHF